MKSDRIATLLVFVPGILEICVRLTPAPDSYLPYIFPLLSAFGGLMLLTHSHFGFQAKTAFFIQVGHTLMSIFSLILACGRWLELKLDGKKEHRRFYFSTCSISDKTHPDVLSRTPLLI